MERPLQRITPRLDPQHYQTYSVKAPLSTHWRRGTCEETGCLAAYSGWKMKIDITTEMGQRQAYYIRKQSGRKFTESRLPNGFIEFTFASGQDCFKEHRVRLERQEQFIVKGGDWRGNPKGQRPRIHTKPEFWVEDFSENQDRLNRIIEKG